MDAELSFRITDTSLDPYLRAFQPQLSPFTSAIASGAIRVVGELYNPDALRVDVQVDDVQLRFFDYEPEERRQHHAERGPAGAAGRGAAPRGRGHRARSRRARWTCRSRSWRSRPTVRRTWRCCRASCRTCARSGRAEVAARITGTAEAPVGLRHGAHLRRAAAPLRHPPCARGPERHRHLQRQRRAPGWAARAARGRAGARSAGASGCRVTRSASSTSRPSAPTCGRDFPKACARWSTPTWRCAGPARRRS